ncbi:MAG: phospholipase/carboxylesterase [Verrucomicrobiales bacterium]|nr:phospholipase/carboxylesterase [Verrucomicrobiales bacterium]
MQKILLLCCAVFTFNACTTMKPAVASKDPAGIGQSAHDLKKVSKPLAAQYLVRLPQDYDADSKKSFPLILFLHGAGERGTNVWKATTHGPSKYIQNHPESPFILVTPLCPSNEVWSSDVLLALLDEVEKTYRVDQHRVYLTGLSMGGYGSWELGLSNPGRFAAMAPICGGANLIHLTLAQKGYWPKSQVEQLQTLGIWAFHGDKDTVVPPSESKRLMEELQKVKVKDFKLTIYPEATHNSWTESYNNPELYEWFLQHKR